jgi:hypothetical protein
MGFGGEQSGKVGKMGFNGMQRPSNTPEDAGKVSIGSPNSYRCKSPRYKRARRRQLALIRKGYDLGTNGLLNTSRDKLYDR